ncbi:MAG: extracellular solute-binding protein, partial [Acidimicrobiales bacterium]
DALANEIKGGTQQGDVFISAAPQPNARLEGPANGSWVSWYAELATSPLVLGYYPESKFAGALKTTPWYDVVSRPGFMVGRTDPVTDPKGVLAVDALTTAASRYHKPALAAIATSSRNVFAESAMVGQLQAGELDAGFFYAVEAAAGHIPTVPLAGTHLVGTYTITILNRAPHAAAAQAFVSFLLSHRGQQILEQNGLSPVKPPLVSGSRSAVPPRLRAAF